MRDALGAQHLLARHREERAGLHRGVVGDDHHAAAGDRADAGDDAGRRRAAPLGVHAPRGPQAEFEEVGVGVDELGDALAGGEPALLVLALDGLRAAAEADRGFLGGEVDGHGSLPKTRNSTTKTRRSHRRPQRGYKNSILLHSVSLRVTSRVSVVRFSLASRRSSDQSLRWRLDGIFSILRYFVTVRRATG